MGLGAYMDLQEIRLAFRKDSGRYDLVNEDGSDNGADRYLNAGQRYLDTLVDAPNAVAINFQDIMEGQRFTSLSDCRILHEIYVNDTTSKTKLIIHRDIKEYIATFPSHHSEMGYGRPSNILYTNLRISPDANTSPVTNYGGYIKWMDVAVNPSGNSNGLIWNPASDGYYTLEVHGKFFTPTLINSTDTTYWTDVYPSVLIWSAMRQIEVGYRNTQGVNDWTAAIKSELFGLEADQIEHTFYGMDQLEG